MLKAITVAGLIALVLAQPAWADAPAEPEIISEESAAYRLGEESCQSVLYRQHAEPGERYYARYADLTGVRPSQLCECVADRFMRNRSGYNTQLLYADGEGDAARILTELTMKSLDGCLPRFDDLPQETRDDILSGPKREWPVDIASAGDVDPATGLILRTPWPPEGEVCEWLVNGKLRSDDLDRKTITAWSRTSGLDASTLCTSCVSPVMRDTLDQASGRGGAWEPGDEEYWRQMAETINDCMTRPAR